MFRIADVTDGTSNTIAFGEWKMGSVDPNRLSIPSNIVWMTSDPSGVTRNSAAMSLTLADSNNALFARLDDCRRNGNPGAPTRNNGTPNPGQAWAFNLPAYSIGNTVLPPNPKYPTCRTMKPGTQNSPGAYGLASNHPGGANIVLADGSGSGAGPSSSSGTTTATTSARRAGGPRPAPCSRSAPACRS